MSDSSDRNGTIENPGVEAMAEAYAAHHGVSLAEGIDAVRVQSAAMDAIDEIEQASRLARAASAPPADPTLTSARTVVSYQNARLQRVQATN